MPEAAARCGRRRTRDRLLQRRSAHVGGGGDVPILSAPSREIVKLPDETFDLNQLEIAPDGQRFLLARPEGAEFATSLNVVLNWSEELKQRVPTK